MKGKERAVEDRQVNMDALQRIQKAISSLLNPTPDIGAGQTSSTSSQGSLGEHRSSIEATPSSMEATPTPVDCPITGLSPSILSHDYDADRFSKFADFLVKMDQIENVSNLLDDDLVSSRSSRTGSFRSTESDPSDGTGLGHMPSSILSTALSESQVTVTTISQGGSDAVCSEDSSAALEITEVPMIPEVPMSWLYSAQETEPLNGEGVSQNQGDTIGKLVPSSLTSGEAMAESDALVENISGMDFGLDLDSESLKQLLDCSLHSPIREHHQLPPDFSDTGYSHIDQFVDDLTSPDGVQASDPPLNVASLNLGIDDPSIPHVADATAGSAPWNGMWHNSCNPDSIKSWLQSTFPLGK